MKSLLIKTPDGLDTEVYLHEGGERLIVHHHGTPSNRPLSPQMAAVFAEHGFTVACPVRPGYGNSGFTKVDGKPTPIDMASNAPRSEAIAQSLGFDEYISFGFSGGGPRALADLALNQGSVAAVSFAGIGPTGQPDLDPLAGLPEEELEIINRVRNWDDELPALFEDWLEGYRAQDFEGMYKNANEPTREWIKSPDAQFRLAQLELAFIQGTVGWMLDEHSMLIDWGFDPRTIKKPLWLIHGTEDTNVDLSSSQWLHRNIPGSKLEVREGFEHSRIFSIEILQWLLPQL